MRKMNSHWLKSKDFSIHFKTLLLFPSFERIAMERKTKPITVIQEFYTPCGGQV